MFESGCGFGWGKLACLKLQDVNFEHTRVNDSILHLLQQTGVSSLCSLNLSETRVTSRGFCLLSHFKTLSCLSMSGAFAADQHGSDDFMFIQWAHSFAPIMTDFSCIGTGINSSEGIRLFFQHASRLTSLTLSNNQWLTDAVVCIVARFCPSLEQLNLKSCIQITDECMLQISSGCKSLRKLDVSYIESLSDRFLLSTIEHRLPFEDLVFEHCKFSGNAIAACVRWCRHTLVHLNVDYCQNIRGDSIASIRASLSKHAKLSCKI